ncbi:MAG: sugar ABC transporter substrate-binding protein [Fuerstiella sp.]|nr:sugar ABC transporter substrate-binding protein [Fuerstiella sp.]
MSANIRTRLGVFLISGLLIPGCADNSQNGSSTGADATTTDSASPAEGESKGSIGYTTMSLTNPFFKVISDSMTKEAAKHGYEVIVVSGDDDVNKQSNQIADFIVQGVSAIVLTPCDPRSIGQAIKKANDNGIPVFTNDTGYDGDEGEVECHIATDNLQGGRLAGEAMVRLLGETGGTVLVVHKPDASSCLLRVQGFTELVDAHNAKDGAAKIEVVATLDGRGSREAGYAVTKDAIVSNPNLSAIFAINDPSALGARSALEEAGKQDQVTIIGFDGEKAGKEAILKGTILCDPIQFPDQMGRTTIEMILKYFEGEDVPQEILIPSKLYYKEDAEKDPALQ